MIWKPRIRCAVYTRKSHEEGLEQEYNSLDAQYDAGANYIQSQRHEGWMITPERYDDGGFTGGNLERPALKRLLADIQRGMIDVVVVYKIDRLSRSLMDFSKLVELFDKHNVTFVSVTQHFNTTTSMLRNRPNASDPDQAEFLAWAETYADHLDPMMIFRIEALEE